MIKVERALIRDVPALTLLDLKCQDYPIPSEFIKEYIDRPNGHGLLASIGNRKVGYALYQTVSDDNESKIPYTVITRLGAHPDFRLLGVSKSLLFEIEKHAWKQCHRCLRLFLPSYRCDDKTDPEYLVPWLDKHGFKISKCESNMFYHYGKRWDAYVFEREL